MLLESPMPGQHLRRVNLIERQRDQSESEAVTSAHARQRPVPPCCSLPPLTRHAPSCDRAPLYEDPSVPRNPHLATCRCVATRRSRPAFVLAQACDPGTAPWLPVSERSCLARTGEVAAPSWMEQSVDVGAVLSLLVR